jgi:CheY-like chemotaxis protein
MDANGSQQTRLQSLEAQLEQLCRVVEEQGGKFQALSDRLLAGQNEQGKPLNTVAEGSAVTALDLDAYKADFIANISHDLRTPLNTIMILAGQLEENSEGTMSDQQVEYATVIRSSGIDLLRIINSTSDAAKGAPGTIAPEAEGPAATSQPAASRLPARRLTSPVTGDTFKGVRVFLVDDEFRNIFAMKALLERGAAVVTFAEDGEDAIRQLKAGHEVDVILMDIMMPGLDGYETTRAIRKLDSCKDVPIIAVTARVMAGERDRCIAAGANDYVPKPVDTSELVATISPWLPMLVSAIEPWR